jgi:hypothetical protein
VTWKLDVGPGPGNLLLNVIRCQDAWRALTAKSRAALVAIADGSTDVHPASTRALRTHGLLDEQGITEAGRRVLRHRPDKSGEQHG